MMGYGTGLGFGIGGWLGMLGFVLLIVGVVVLVAWLVRRTEPGSQPSSSRQEGQDALEILRVRFAKGEITRDEYLATRQTLEGDR